MSKEPKHELFDFMLQISSEMAAEYERIFRRSSEDPGTAGDEGEENWAELLRDWLPQGYEVVTKGQILSQLGETSPQVDVLVLKPSYPKKLRNKKKYLAAGIAAAFECKNTLKSSHIHKAVETCKNIKALCPKKHGSPYKEITAPIFFGLLAHSHSWKGELSRPSENIYNNLQEADKIFVDHPRDQLDIICVADVGSWQLTRISYMTQESIVMTEAPIEGISEFGFVGSGHTAHTASQNESYQNFTPVGGLISHLFRRLAWNDTTMQDVADYYRATYIGGGGSGNLRFWPADFYSENVRRGIAAGKLTNNGLWSDWDICL